LLWLLLLAAGPARAADGPAAPDAPAAPDTLPDGAAAVDDAGAVPAARLGGESSLTTRFGSLFYLEHHGTFRFRSDLFWQADLGIRGVSGVSPPLLENEGNEGFHDGHAGDRVLAGANIRFRYEPVLGIGERVRVFARIDVLDNLVLGSTPAVGPSAFGLWAYGTDTAVPPTSDGNSLRDAIRAKAVWGELLLFDAITVKLGRMPDHWGLGLLRNGGFDRDDDFGSEVDRIEAMGSLEGFHFGFTYDFFVEGFTSEDRWQALGQPYGLGKADDVGQWIVFLEQQPRRPEELAQREHDLFVARRPVFDWGIMSAFRMQDLSSERQERTAGLADVCLTGPDPTTDIAYDCLQMVPRDAFLWYPDVWARLQWSPRAGHLLRVELEVALVYGDIGVTEALSRTDTSKDVLAAGGVLQGEYRVGPTSFGLELGFATGDDTNGVFGIFDGSEVVDVVNPSSQSFQIRNRTLSNFKFHRAYRVDHLLYREVVGAITNSLYLKPWASHVFWTKGTTAIGGRLDLLYARTLDAGGTPGRALDLGVELDATAFLRLGEAFDARLVFAALFPLGALDNAALGLDAEPALTVQANLFWMF
jgi:uncharacterized protein (TIGR04551 family)